MNNSAKPATRNDHDAGSTLLGDRWLLICALILAGIGLVMVYSSSSVLAEKRYFDSAFFVKQQLKHLALGLVFMGIAAYLDYEIWKKLCVPLLIALFISLLLVLFSNLGHTAGGASRWLKFFGFSIQPSELAKPALVLFLAYWLSEHQDKARTLRTFIFCLAIVGVLTLPILLQPDLGLAVTLFIITIVLLFMAGTRIIFLAGTLVASLPILYLLIFRVSYRLDRVTAFLRPWDDPADTGFQIIHSFLAFGTGGITGAGLGNSVQKLFYLPESHTDFILSVLAEEMGLIGVGIVLTLFLILIWRGISIALHARDLFGSLIAMGATLIIGMQGFVNAAVVMGMLPTKGLALPFISCGGSSLLANFICVGLLLSVAAHRKKV